MRSCALQSVASWLRYERNNGSTVGFVCFRGPAMLRENTLTVFCFFCCWLLPVWSLAGHMAWCWRSFKRMILVFVCSSLHLCLSCSVAKFHLVPLRPLVGLRPPSNFFIHSLSTRSVQDTTPEGVLSSCGCHERSEQSRSSQGYIACCGCHEILIPLCYPQQVFCPDQ